MLVRGYAADAARDLVPVHRLSARRTSHPIHMPDSHAERWFCPHCNQDLPFGRLTPECPNCKTVFRADGGIVPQREVAAPDEVFIDPAALRRLTDQTDEEIRATAPDRRERPPQLSSAIFSSLGRTLVGGLVWVLFVVLAVGSALPYGGGGMGMFTLACIATIAIPIWAWWPVIAFVAVKVFDLEADPAPTNVRPTADGHG